MSGEPITWGWYIRVLRAEGVRLDVVEQEDLSEEGDRIVTKMLTRRVGGRLLWTEAGFGDPDEPITYYRRRQIANELRLDPTRFIFEDRP